LGGGGDLRRERPADSKNILFRRGIRLRIMEDY